MNIDCRWKLAVLSTLVLMNLSMNHISYAETWPGDEPPESPDNEWEMVEVDGAVCGDGSPYRFFVHYASFNNNLMVISEPGGACWDRDGCSGEKPLGASHPDGIKPDFMRNIASSINAIQSPFTWRNHPWDRIDAGSWNKVFLPYCTGDIFAGDKITVYEDPAGEKPPLTYHHKGRTNTQKAIEWTNANFPVIGRFLSVGASAGGAGSLVNYYFWREGLNINEDAILINDSGPIFPAFSNEQSFSYNFQANISDAWGVSTWLNKIDPYARSLLLKNQDKGIDFGSINIMLAELYPLDKFITIVFSMDEVFPAYLYGEEYNLDWTKEIDRKAINDMWQSELENLVLQFEDYENLSYFIPYYRKLAFSHCATLLDFHLSDITKDDGHSLLLRDYLRDAFQKYQIIESFRERENLDDLNKSNAIHDLANSILSKNFGR